MGKPSSRNSNKRPPPTPPPQYKGVRRRTWGSWVSEIRAPQQKTRIWLGSYSTPEAAARAYDAALLCLKGSSAGSFNFPAALPHHPISATPMSPKSIQRLAAAAAAAAATHPPSPPPPPPQGPPSSEDAEDDRQSTVTSEDKVDDDQAWNDHGAVMDVGGFQLSPKCLDDDHMPDIINPVLVSSSSSSSCSWEECEEMGDLNLWSFC